MIRVICLNPVIDRFYFIENYTPGKLYRDNVSRLFAGGKGVNAARVVAQLGHECSLYGFLGKDNGQIIKSDMQKHNVILNMIEYEGETRTTINIVDTLNRQESEITEKSTEISKHYIDLFWQNLKEDIGQNDIIICSGAPMSGMDHDIYMKISELCESKKAKCLLDTSGLSFKASLPGKYHMCKPNTRELQEYFGVCCSKDIQIIELAIKLMMQGVENTLISMGKNGGLLINKNATIWASVPDIKVVSTIGSGDATMAGYAVGMARGYDERKSLQLAMACGVCNAMHEKVGYIDQDALEDILDKVEINEK